MEKKPRNCLVLNKNLNFSDIQTKTLRFNKFQRFAELKPIILYIKNLELMTLKS